MKKILLTAAVCSFIIACTGCGKDEPLPKPPVDNQTATQAAETETVSAETAAETQAEETEAAAEDAQTDEETDAAEIPAETKEAGNSDEKPVQTDAPQTSAAPAATKAAETNAPATQAPTKAASSDYYAPPPPVYDIPGLTYITDPITGVKILLASKSYSMPADFAPGLEDITYEYFTKMQNDAAAQGLYLQLSSGYRSYYDQQIVYNGYVYDVGSDVADTFSARPGYSEHQTGLVIDLNSIDDSFGYTAEAAWVAEHAHEYGFIIRYPNGMDNITGYKYEPWHIRYVGSEVATEIYNRQTCLETYLGLPNSEYSGSYTG